MPKYLYSGPVMLYDQIIDAKWQSSTIAMSIAKARSNLTYQYKKKYGYEPFAAITLPGDIKIERVETQMKLDI